MKKKIFYISIVTILIFTVLWFIIPKNRQPVKIGLSVTLTGAYTDLGREIRDGALIAVQIINEEGGVKGSPLKLIIRDNKYNIEQTKKNYEELINEGVIAVIGPVTSTTAKNILPIINEKKILTIAQTPTSNELAGLDDYMIRLRPTSKQDAEVLAKYVKEKINPKKIVIVYDVSNPVYTIEFSQNFMQNFSKDVKFNLIPYKEGEIDIRELSNKILSYSPDTVLLITEVYSTALIAQNLRILKPDIILITAPWAKFQRLIENGGKRIEGLVSIETFEEDYQGRTLSKIQKKIF